MLHVESAKYQSDYKNIVTFKYGSSHQLEEQSIAIQVDRQVEKD